MALELAVVVAVAVAAAVAVVALVAVAVAVAVAASVMVAVAAVCLCVLRERACVERLQMPLATQVAPSMALTVIPKPPIQSAEPAELTRSGSSSADTPAR